MIILNLLKAYRDFFVFLFSWNKKKEDGKEEKTYLGFPSIKETLDVEFDLSKFIEKSIFYTDKVEEFYKNLNYLHNIDFYKKEISKEYFTVSVFLSQNCYIKINGWFLCEIFIRKDNNSKWENVTNIDGPWHCLIRACFEKLDCLVKDIKSKEVKIKEIYFIEDLRKEGKIKNND